MLPTVVTALLTLSTFHGAVSADMHRVVPRQAAATTTTRASATSSGASTSATARPAVTSSPLASLSLIGTATTQEVTVPLPATYTAGSTPPVSRAPALPDISTLNPANYPTLDKLPPTDSPEVQAWILEADLANAPNIPPTGINGCANSTNAAAVSSAGSSGSCWWTCGGCTRATDITYCPNRYDYGLSFDDGPSPDTPRLLNLLAEQNIKSTFFVVGSRVISRPQMLQTEYMQGHQISVHTWAHPPLTTLTNEGIVAELGWSRKVIRDVTGVTPNTFRPPYGDIDDRVRYIGMKMGMRPIIWTTASGTVFDTKDYQIGSGQQSATQAYANFTNFITLAETSLTRGIIVLSHDLYQQSVDLAVNYVLPKVISDNVLKLQTINQCLGEDAANAYIETNDNKTSVIQSSSTVAGASGTGFVSFPTGTAGASSTRSGTGASATGGSSSSGTGASGTSSATTEYAAGGIIAALLGAVGAFLL